MHPREHKIMEVIRFRWHAKYGHFLRAEANINALSYPVPPRTAVLGLVGALLGLDKDELAQELDSVQIAVAGRAPQRFWHRVKLRKDPPAALPLRVRRTQSMRDGSTAEEKAALIRQEWLLAPDFQIDLAWPQQPARLSELTERLQQRRWHFTPCMGLSELLAEVDFMERYTATPLAAGRYLITGICPAHTVKLLAGEGLGVHLLPLPYRVSPDRVFSHQAYYIERQGQPLPVETAAAWQVGEQVVVFA